MSASIEFRVAASLDDQVIAYMLRAIVFCGEQEIAFSHERDEHDSSSIHIIGVVGDEPAAVGRLRFVDGFAKLERIAVVKPQRGNGYGHALTEFMMQCARERGFHRFKMHAQSHLKEFYAKHGFQACGEPFEEEEIEHLLMVAED